MNTEIIQKQLDEYNKEHIEDLYFKVEGIINKFIEESTCAHLDLEDLKDKVLNAIESERHEQRD